jgi:acetylornithine deacetylase/succinyl-diaminopimelate desuccinylase-like protein
VKSAASAPDEWLSMHAPIIEWAREVPTAEVALDEPLIPLVVAASAAAGRPSRISGTDGWHDGASFTLGGTPSIVFGPGDGTTHGHIIDEYMPIDEIVALCKALAIAAWRSCGAT